MCCLSRQHCAEAGGVRGRGGRFDFGLNQSDLSVLNDSFQHPVILYLSIYLSLSLLFLPPFSSNSADEAPNDLRRLLFLARVVGLGGGGGNAPMSRCKRNFWSSAATASSFLLHLLLPHRDQLK